VYLGVCKACRWKGIVYYDGDRWTENDVAFYCSSSEKKVRPGCYVERNRVKCTGAIPGIRNLSKISEKALFLCESGDEIRSLNDRCNVRPECEDKSDERNCPHYYCRSMTKYGVHWERTQFNREILKNCSLVNASWEGVFSLKCEDNCWIPSWSIAKCRCEQGSIINYFRLRVAQANETNLLNISMELTSSADNFSNNIVFHELFSDLFEASVRLLSPITQENSELALLYVRHVIEVTGSYDVHKGKLGFCCQSLSCDQQLNC